RFERQLFGTGWRSPAAVVQLFRFARGLRDQKFDLVLDLQGLFRSGWIVAQTKAPVRAGLSNAREMGWLSYTHKVPTSWDLHAVERYLDLADALGCGQEPVEFHFAVDDDDRQAIAAMLRDLAAGNGTDGGYAVLLPGTIWETKRWPVERFAALVGPLRDRFGLRSVVA